MPITNSFKMAKTILVMLWSVIGRLIAEQRRARALARMTRMVRAAVRQRG
jgi:hypothetical protein